MAKKIKLKPGQVLANAVLATKAPTNTHPHTIARIVEDAEVIPDIDARTRRRLQNRWTVTKVEAMATDAILDRLKGLGVDMSEAGLRLIAAEHHSAWEASRTFSRTARGDDADFIGLAFCTLWKRWVSEHPSVEMIDDWIVEGYLCSEEHRHDEGLSLWRRAWEALRSRLDATATTTAAAERAVFSGLTPLLNWTQDYVDEHVHIAPSDLDAGVQLIDELLAQFSAETPAYRRHLTTSKAVMYEVADRFDDAERTAAAIIEAWPENAIGYVTLADLARKQNRRDEAIAILERALSLPVVDARDFDLKPGLEELRAERSSGPENA